ncbi:MAG TPA: glutathione S-transferase family protein [Caulobacteraceae bacterium]|jgi:glutathione S-transferase|nr:glutathione S-transferase family protein [Caulobacteraceae bacterium]
MKLYSVDLSPFAARVRAAIYAKNLPVEIVAPPESGTKSDEYLALNPMGRVPVLVAADGFALPESDTIVEYLADAFPDSGLRPSTPEGKARARLIARVTELYVMQQLQPLFGQMNPATRDQVVVDDAIEKLKGALVHLNVFLGDGPYAAGETLTTADCALIPVLFFIQLIGPIFGAGDMLEGLLKLSDYAERLKMDPVAQKVGSEMQAGLRARQGG